MARSAISAVKPDIAAVRALAAGLNLRAGHEVEQSRRDVVLAGLTRVLAQLFQFFETLSCAESIAANRAAFSLTSASIAASVKSANT